MNWNADLYQDKHAFVFNFGESLIKLLNPQKEEHILDLGCGTGELTYEIGKACREVIGLDQSPAMISKAKAVFPSINFIIGDAAHFQLEAPFDAIFSNATLHWVKDYRGAIQSMYDHLVPGGRMVVEFGGKGNVATIIQQIRHELRQRGHQDAADLVHWYFPSIGEYASALERVGFRVTFAQHYDRPTQLADQQKGIQDWIGMFGKAFFDGIPETEQQDIAAQVQEALRPQLFHDEHWFADYKRIRVVAIKE